MIAVVSWPDLLWFSLSLLPCLCWGAGHVGVVDDVVHSMLYKKHMAFFYFTTNCDFSWLLKGSFKFPNSVCVIHGSIQTGSNIYFSAPLTTVVFFNNKVRCGTLERAGLCLSIEQNTFTVITKMAFCSAHYLTVESCAAARGQNIIAAFKMLLQPSCYLPLIIWYSLIVVVSISSIYIIGL